MTIYSIMPPELVFQGIDQQPGPYIAVQVGDVRLQLEAVSPGVGRIVRLMEGPLHAYLRPELTPGTIVAYGQTTSSTGE